MYIDKVKNHINSRKAITPGSQRCMNSELAISGRRVEMNSKTLGREEEI
jgi:Tfp pilus assembly major pilin PilA